MKAGIFTVRIEKLLDMGVQETRHFKMVFEPGTVFDFDAGQFINILVPETPERKALKRPYSIASPPIWKGYIDLCWKKVPGGAATSYLWTIKEGDTIQIQGPLGRFTARQPLPKGIIFISTGTGIAPFRSMIHTLLDQKAPAKEGEARPGTETGRPVKIWNIFGNRFEEDVLYKEEFEALAQKNSNFQNVFTVSRPKTWKGETQYVQHMLKKHVPDAQDKHIYICGLTNMINEVVATATEMGFAKEQIFFEKYD